LSIARWLGGVKKIGMVQTQVTEWGGIGFLARQHRNQNSCNRSGSVKFEVPPKRLERGDQTK
jgi:hypothetical protein